MIFKLCGSPSEDYFKKLKLTTSYRPTHHYKPTYQENFSKFPSSSHPLLTTLLHLNPTNRGTAASALQTEVCFSAIHTFFQQILVNFLCTASSSSDAVH